MWLTLVVVSVGRLGSVVMKCLKQGTIAVIRARRSTILVS